MDAGIFATGAQVVAGAGGCMSNLPERRRMFVGASFGRFVVTAYSPGSASADVTCQCGTTKTVQRRHLLSGASKSCGCLHREVASSAKNGLTHGEGADERRSPEYISWNGMLQRCLNPKATNFRLYGARGISVCEAWKKFEGFLADMGRRPTRGHTLDRIDVNGNYEP